MSTSLASRIIQSPVGAIRLVANAEALVAVLWENAGPRREEFSEAIEDLSHPVLGEAARQLAAYFAGKRRVFSVKLDFTGTEFQKMVWLALQTIPYGETRSYRELATQIGRPTAVRAVGGALGRNPISVLAPCHRVIGVGGKLTGFAGGLGAKARLLEIERSAIFKSASL